MSLIFFTSEVWKFDRSSVVKLLQSLNIACMSVTFAVSKKYKSSSVKDSQPENMLLIPVT